MSTEELQRWNQRERGLEVSAAGDHFHGSRGY